MRRFKVDQAQKSCKSDQSSVEVSTCEVVGGGAI